LTLSKANEKILVRLFFQRKNLTLNLYIHLICCSQIIYWLFALFFPRHQLWSVI